MHRLISIADGIALDVKYSTYCELDGDMKVEQRKNTYMQDYSAAIQAAKKYEAKKWNEEYYKSSGGGRNEFCAFGSGNPNCVDGLDWGKYDVGKFLLPHGYCERCAAMNFTSFGPPGLRLSLNCRSALP